MLIFQEAYMTRNDIDKKETIRSFSSFILAFLLAFIINGGVFAQCTITISPSTLPDGEVGAYYSQTLTASGGYGYYSYTVLSGSLPMGLSLDSATGVLSGIPSYPGVSSFVIDAYDSMCYTSGTQSYNLNIADPCSSSITINPPTLPDAYINEPYSVTLSASGGTPPYYFYGCGDSLWPPGLNLSSDGVLSGTPTLEDVYTFQVCVEDSCGGGPLPFSGGPGEAFIGYGSITYTLTVGRQCPVVRFYPLTFPNGTPNLYYSQQISASGGVAPYNFILTGGTLPPGLKMDSNGLVSGTPNASGSYTFFIKTIDAVSCTDQMSYTVTIGCETGFGTLSGLAGVSGDNDPSFYVLNGPGVTGTATATSSSGDSFTAALLNGSFSFGSIPAGSYKVSVVLNYNDKIIYDAELLSSGCPAPQDGAIIKEVSSREHLVDVPCDSHTTTQIGFNAPVVMVHGIFDCY
jgi:hypothetical protein